MQPIERLERERAKKLRGLLFDLDDTLLDRGLLTEEAYSSLFRLAESGLGLIAVTGRPSGWCEVLVRQWPVAGAVSENGAIAFLGTTRLDELDAAARRERRALLDRIVDELRERLPELEPADDVAHRVSDFAFDVGEHRRVAPEVIRQARELARARGACTTLSSVHLHVSLDAADKASGAVRLIGRALGQDPAEARSTWAFIGDSENDAACFAAFRTTIAVANFSGRPSVGPRFVTRRARGAGFAEAARTLVALRSG